MRVSVSNSLCTPLLWKQPLGASGITPRAEPRPRQSYEDQLMYARPPRDRAQAGSARKNAFPGHPGITRNPLSGGHHEAALCTYFDAVCSPAHVCCTKMKSDVPILSRTALNLPLSVSHSRAIRAANWERQAIKGPDVGMGAPARVRQGRRPCTRKHLEVDGLLLLRSNYVYNHPYADRTWG